MAAVQNLLGLAIGPVLAGWLSDLYGLTTALTVIPLLCLASAATFWYGSRSYERDRDAVPVPPGPSALGSRRQEGHP
jgi:MFS family permease